MTKKRAKKKRPALRLVPGGVQLVKNAAGHPSLVGYARVSKVSQSLDAQIAELTAAGCCRIYCEQVSGAATKRPAFAALIDNVRKGDTVVVVALDRLGRRSSQLVLTLDSFRELGVHFRDLRSGVNTQSANGRVFLMFLVALAEAERVMCSERIRESLAHSKAPSGRPFKYDRVKLSLAAKMREEGHSTRRIGEALHLGATTVRRMLLLREREDPRQLRLTE